MRCLIFLPLAAALCGCGEKDFSKTKEYSGVVDKVYVTKKPLLVYSHGGFKGSLAVPGQGGKPALEDLQSAFPQRYRDDTIIGLMPPGSRVKIAEVYTHWSTVRGEEIRFGLKVLDPHEFSSLNIWDVGLIDYGRSPLRLDQSLFEEVSAVQK